MCLLGFSSVGYVCIAVSHPATQPRPHHKDPSLGDTQSGLLPEVKEDLSKAAIGR